MRSQLWKNYSKYHLSIFVCKYIQARTFCDHELVCMVYGFKSVVHSKWLSNGKFLTKIFNRLEQSAWTQRTIQENPSLPATAM